MEQETKGIRYQSEHYATVQGLMHRVNEQSLMAEHRRQDRKKATGIDGVNKAQYDENATDNIRVLVERMKKFQYKPQPVRRTYIPKANGKQRPLGIPAYEDRLVQGVMANALNEVYEPRFLDCSHGFRPGRSAHDVVRYIDGKMVIVPEEAEIVRQIFSDYLSGLGRYSIAKKLILDGIAPANGNTWSDTSIRHILTNPTYTGNLILQKTYREDFRSKAPLVNKGTRRKYFVEESHEAIIPQKVFDAVQDEMAARAKHSQRSKISDQKEPKLYCGILKCGNCGRTLRFYHTNAKQYDKAVWACPRYYTMGKAICPSQKIPEDILIEKTKEVLSVDTLTQEDISGKVKSILVTGYNKLQFNLKDGTNVDTVWQHKSRKSSWTEEMRQAARARTLQRQKKEVD